MGTIWCEWFKVHHEDDIKNLNKAESEKILKSIAGLLDWPAFVETYGDDMRKIYHMVNKHYKQLPKE